MQRVLAGMFCLVLTVKVSASTNWDEGVIVSFDPSTGKLVLISYNHYGAEKSVERGKGYTFQQVTLGTNAQTAFSLDGDMVTGAIACKPGRKVLVFGKGRRKPANSVNVLSEHCDRWSGTVTSLKGDTLQLSWKQLTDAKDFTVTVSADAEGRGLLKPGAEVVINAGRVTQTVVALSADSLPPPFTGACQHTASGVITGVTGDSMTAKKFTKDGWVDLTMVLKADLILDHRKSKQLVLKNNPKLIKQVIIPGRRFLGYCYRNRNFANTLHIVTDDDSTYGTVGSIEGSTITVVSATGTSQKVAISAKAAVTLDGETSNLTALKPGMRVRVFAARKQKITAK